MISTGGDGAKSSPRCPCSAWAHGDSVLPSPPTRHVAAVVHHAAAPPAAGLAGKQQRRAAAAAAKALTSSLNGLVMNKNGKDCKIAVRTGMIAAEAGLPGGDAALLADILIR